MNEDEKPLIKKKPTSGIVIVGYNLIVLAVYTLLFKLVEEGGGFILDAIVLFFHVIFCLGMSLGKKSWWWVLAALLVLIIGFSTCTTFNFNLH